MRKKILALSLAVLMVAVIAIGGTLAYFTDTEDKTNTFTVGNVDITLNENFDENTAKLLPGISITKEVSIALNENSSDAYVWYTYEIPTELVNFLEVTINDEESETSGAYWISNYRDPYETGEEENSVTVYTNIYTGMLSNESNSEATTINGMTSVTLKSGVDYSETAVVNENGEEEPGYVNAEGKAIAAEALESFNIKVTAYAIQAAGFESNDESGENAYAVAYDAYYAQYPETTTPVYE